jgi:hypothetical protein
MAIDFKYLGKKLTDAGLWGKPLNEMEKDDIAKLSFYLQTAQLKSSKHCGTCFYQGWKKLSSCCTHPRHPAVIPIWILALGDCVNWMEYDAKDLGTNILKKEKRVPVDQIKDRWEDD